MTITHAVAVLFPVHSQSLPARAIQPWKVYSPEGWWLNVRSRGMEKGAVVR